MGSGQSGISAIFNALVHDSLRIREMKLVLRNSKLAHARPHRQPHIVNGIAIEIPAVSVLVRLVWHGDLHVNVAPFPWFVPAVDLHRHPIRQGDVENMEGLALATLLKSLSLSVVSNAGTD